MSDNDLIQRIDAIVACQVGPSDEWSKATKDGYNQAATDCSMNILRIDPAVLAELPEVKALVAAALQRAAEVCDDLAVGYAKHKGVPDALHDAARDVLALIDTDHAAALEAVKAQAREEAGPPFHFDRYVNGVLMAEGVTIEREASLSDAMRVAAKIAAKGPNGEVPVLVLTTQASRNRAGKVQP